VSELAFNINGDPFDVPTNAAGWRAARTGGGLPATGCRSCCRSRPTSDLVDEANRPIAALRARSDFDRFLDNAAVAVAQAARAG
jgi:hypothetical protein